MAYCEEGLASWYSVKSSSSITASGERYREDRLTCASWNYPFNTLLRVTYKDKSVIVRVNDRGPNKRLHRLIDLSRGAFEHLAPLRQGLIKVRVEKVT